MSVTRAMVNAKVRSDKLYGFIIKYFLSMGCEERVLSTIDPNVPIFFFFSLAKAYPTLSDNDKFFDFVNSYLQANMEQLSVKHCEICLET